MSTCSRANAARALEDYRQAVNLDPTIETAQQSAAMAERQLRQASADKMPLRIGVNALYLIPGGVGGTEIYLRQLLAAIAEG